MKRIKSKKINAAIIAGALSASIVLGGVATALSFNGFNNIPKFVNAIESNYAIKETTKADAKTYYVAPNGKIPSNDVTVSGTEDDPYQLRYLLTDPQTPLKAGDTVLLKPGTYKETQTIRVWPDGISGEFDGYITVKNASETEKVILDFSSQRFDGNNRGVQIDTDYWYFYGIDICGAGDNGMYIGGSYNVVENCEFYNNRDTGLQLGRSGSELSNIKDWPCYNLIKNCTSHNNYDNETFGENADGFAAKLTVGYGNIFDGCIAYRNSDDGWDLFAKVDSGNIGAVIMYNCVAFENGYLEKTQAECNALFPEYRSEFDEDNVNSYLTRDGDGNGFKLGGSVMEGDVYLYNCLSFNNRMHGVTDNSNPGVLSIKNVTAYNNSAGIDNNPQSSTFGQIILNGTGIAADGNSANINMARQTYSYNLISKVVSVNKDLKTVAADEYRGAVEYSYFDMVNGKAKKIEECVDASQRTEDYAQSGAQVNAISADIFAQLPADWTDATNPVYSYNLSGLRNTTVHSTYRNSDGSINMGNMLRIKDYSTLFGDDNKIGADLSKESWDAYEHYSYFNASNAESAEDAAVKSALATLDLNTNVNATFQDFDLVVTMPEVKITWKSSDTSKIAINTDTAASPSGTKDARAIVYRGGQDTTVTLTAEIEHERNASVKETKQFVINLKADVPTIGNAVIEGVNEGLVIFDQFDKVEEPSIVVQNAADYNGKLLKEGAYTVETTVMYTSDKELTPVQIHHFTPNVAGIYHITNTVKLGTQSKNFSYTIYVASPTANVQFSDTPSIMVNRDGYTISGPVSSATGVLYAYSSATAIENITAEQVIANGKGYEFRADDILFQFENANSSSYYIYYVLCNLNGDATSQVGSVEVKTEDIKDIADFKAMLLDNNSSTIYLLKNDLDLSEENNWIADVTSKNKGFSGLLNGMGHTVKNFTVSATGSQANDEEAALFYRLNGGTVENIKFENFHIASTKNKVGIFATTYGGYIYNVAMKNIYVKGAQRVAALVGQAMNGEVRIDQISLINDAVYTEVSKDICTESTFGLDKYYVLEGTEYKQATEFDAEATYYVRAIDIDGTRSAGIIGDIQASSANNSTQTYISNCYVKAVIGPAGEQFKGSIIGRFDDRNAKDVLEISYCVSDSILYGRTYVGGIAGSSNNTGAGITRINNCVFIGDLYYGSLITPLTAAEKNCSGIVGRYSGSADCVVNSCFAKFEDHNTNHGVLGEIVLYGYVSQAAFWTNMVKLPSDNWQFVTGANPDDPSQVIAVAPYVTLTFLGNWN